MCLVLKENKRLNTDLNLHYATEDIVCYKYLKEDMNSPFQDFQRKLNKEERVVINKRNLMCHYMNQQEWLMITTEDYIYRPATCEESTQLRAKGIKLYNAYGGICNNEVDEGLYSYAINYPWLKFGNSEYKRCFKCIIPKHTWYYKGYTKLGFVDENDLLHTIKTVPTYASECLILVEEIPLDNNHA